MRLQDALGARAHAAGSCRTPSNSTVVRPSSATSEGVEDAREASGAPPSLTTHAPSRAVSTTGAREARSGAAIGRHQPASASRR